MTWLWTMQHGRLLTGSRRDDQLWHTMLAILNILGQQDETYRLELAFFVVEQAHRISTVCMVVRVASSQHAAIQWAGGKCVYLQLSEEVSWYSCTMPRHERPFD